jgi:hypothetical protein
VSGVVWHRTTVIANLLKGPLANQQFAAFSDLAVAFAKPKLHKASVMCDKKHFAKFHVNRPLHGASLSK